MSLTYDQIEFIQKQLCDDEFSTDEEIRDILIDEAHIPHFYIDELLSYRKIFLSNPLATLDFECQKIKVKFAD